MFSRRAWHTDYTCHHAHRLNERSANCGVRNVLPRLAHSHAVFSYKDICGSTVLGTPESVGMNGQIDWQAQQISHLVCSLAGQRCSEAWGTLWTWTGHSITNLGETAERRGGARMGLSERYGAILSWNWNWNWKENGLNLSVTKSNEQNVISRKRVIRDSMLPQSVTVGHK